MAACPPPERRKVMTSLSIRTLACTVATLLCSVALLSASMIPAV